MRIRNDEWPELRILPVSYGPTDAMGDDVRFKNYGLAPKSAADFAFLLTGMRPFDSPYKITFCRGTGIAVEGHIFMGLIRNIFWVVFFLAATFTFIVLFEHGFSNFAANAKKEAELMPVIFGMKEKPAPKAEPKRF